MQAALAHRYGSPAVLTLGEVAEPTPGPRDVLVAVVASAVTQGDRRMRAADFPGIAWLPGRLLSGLFRPRHRVPGSTFAGRVVAVGAQVTRFAVGDDVFGESMRGAHAERLVMRADGAIAHMPRGLDHRGAACLPYGAHTAYTYLHRLAGLRAGEHVVVIGAGGGVGRYAAQALAAAAGAHVTAVCSARHAAQATALGAHAVVAPGPWRGGPVDVVLDTSATARFADWRPHLTAGGRFLATDLSVRILLDMLRTRRRPQRALFGVAYGSAESLAAVAAAVDAGALTPVIAATFPLAALRDAHTCLEARPQGDVIIEVGPAPRRLPSPPEGSANC